MITWPQLCVCVCTRAHPRPAAHPRPIAHARPAAICSAAYPHCCYTCCAAPHICLVSQPTLPLSQHKSPPLGCVHPAHPGTRTSKMWSITGRRLDAHQQDSLPTRISNRPRRSCKGENRFLSRTGKCSTSALGPFQPAACYLTTYYLPSRHPSSTSNSHRACYPTYDHPTIFMDQDLTPLQVEEWCTLLQQRCSPSRGEVSHSSRRSSTGQSMLSGPHRDNMRAYRPPS